MTRLFTEYWELAESLFPELHFSHRDARGSDSTWAQFRPANLDKGRRILHKMPERCVDLEFARFGEKVDELIRLNPALTGDGLKFVRTGQSASLSAQVPPLNVREDFTAQRESALAALKAAHRLLSLAKLVRTE